MSASDRPDTFYDSPDRVTAGTIAAQHRAIVQAPNLTTTFDLVPHPLVLLNATRQIVHANAGALEFLGVTHEQLLGQRIGDALRCQHAPGEPHGCGTTKACRLCGAGQAIRASAHARVADSRECHVSCRGGSGETAVDIRVWTTPFEVDGHPLVVVNLRDISDQERRRMLERLFFHDVLNASGGLRGLLATLPDLDTGDWLDAIGEASHLADELVHAIEAHRDVTLAERGDLVPEWKDVRADEILHDVVATYRHHSVAAGRHLRIAGDAPPVMLRTDPVLLHRVVGNLIKNALEAVDAGTSVSVTFACAPDPAFHVANPGVMPERVQLSLFQRSFSTKAKTGRGLGVYGARLLTERYLGGSISFRSTPTEGTVFTCTLPAASVVGTCLPAASSARD